MLRHSGQARGQGEPAAPAIKKEHTYAKKILPYPDRLLGTDCERTFTITGTDGVKRPQ